MEHHFDVDIASEYGVIEAILLNRFWFWIEKNRTEGTNYHDGHYWTYNSTKAIAELFPYLSAKQVRTALGKLVDKGVLMTGRYNKLPYDRTLWYAFTPKGEQIMLGNFHLPKWANDNCPNGKMTFAPEGEPIPVNTPIIKPITEDNIHLPEKENVKEEFEKLWSLYPNKKGKSTAEQKYIKARKDGTTYEEVEKGVLAYKRYIEVRQIEPQYIKHGSTFFSKKSWEDDWTVKDYAGNDYRGSGSQCGKLGTGNGEGEGSMGTCEDVWGRIPAAPTF